MCISKYTSTLCCLLKSQLCDKLKTLQSHFITSFSNVFCLPLLFACFVRGEALSCRNGGRHLNCFGCSRHHSEWLLWSQWLEMSNYLPGHIPHPLNQRQANRGETWHTESQEDSRHTEQATFQFTPSLNEGFFSPFWQFLLPTYFGLLVQHAARFKFKLQNAYHSLTLVLTVLHGFFFL